MIIDILHAGSGDCLLITAGDQSARILVDAGTPEAYKKFICKHLATLRAANQALDVVYVSHIDADHIGGVMDMLDDETAWRVYDHMQAKGRTSWKQPPRERPPVIGQIWHNAFMEMIAGPAAPDIDSVHLGSALADNADRLMSAFAMRQNPAALAAAEEFRMLAASVRQAIAVSMRIAPDQLKIPLNKDFKGDLMIWTEGAKPLKVGTMRATVLGPMQKQLDDLRAKDWKTYVQSAAGKKAIGNLRKKHAKDKDNLASGGIAFGGSEIVTPPNVASLIILLEDQGKRVLLTGDAADKDIMTQLEKNKLFDNNRVCLVDVFKVPHHGADNSFSPEFADCIRADHYIFCGDGEHGNPELGVINGYLDSLRKKPHPAGRPIKFWFNCSEPLAIAKHKSKWTQIKRIFATKAPVNVTAEFMLDDKPMKLQL